MSEQIEKVRKIHANAMRKHELHMRSFNRMLIGFFVFTVLVVFSSIMVLSGPELLSVPEIIVQGHFGFILALMIFMGASLFGIISWQQWRMTRFTRLAIELLKLFSGTEQTPSQTR